MTPHQYIIRCRLRRAMKLLARDELTLADIALEVGCSCQSHLTTLFRKHLGTTPGAFRLSAREGQRRPAQISSVSSRYTPNQGAMRGQRSGFAAARILVQ
jgi:AraC family transcriptional regulator